MPAAGRVLLVAASVLSAGTGLVLLLWAADTIRARAEPMDDGIYDQLLLDAYRRYGMSKHFAPPALSISDRGRLGERIRATGRAQKVRGEYLGGPPPFGWAYTRRASSYRCREQQAALKRIRTLAAKGLSPYKISADLKARGTPLSHVTVREVIAGRRSPHAAKDPLRWSRNTVASPLLRDPGRGHR